LTNNSYDSICSKINEEWRNLQKPDKEDLIEISKKFNVDISIVRECVGLADYYSFVLDD
tara:strand:- start:1119 stop:1295 length:177 start_codon:yes stop_codon:yes gene_type:complete